MKYKVGDKVRVRKDLIVGKKYGAQDFAYGMLELRGKIVTIKCATDGFYRVEEDDNKCPYSWTDEMLEPAITNWDKVKEEFTLEDIINHSGICTAIHKARKEDDCRWRNCNDCKEWLKQPYQESILDDVEKGYLRAVIKPWRDKVKDITLCKYCGTSVFILIAQKNYQAVMLPLFELGTMYKGMEIDKKYTLEDLDL